MRKHTATLYDWAFKTRGVVSRIDIAEGFRKKVSAMPVGAKVVAPTEFYVFGRPNPYFDGGWIGSSNIKSVKKIDARMLEIRTTTAKEPIIASLRDYRSR